MNFALLGDHPDGLDAACALAQRGHVLAAHVGSELASEYLRRQGLQPRRTRDLEDVLADPAITLVIVAVALAQRGNVLRRAVQSERHVLCVHPPDATPVTAFEAANIQSGTRQLLLPLLPEALHPALARFADLLRELPRPWIVDVERWSSEEYLLEATGEARRPALPGWDILRRIGGEVVEVFALTPADELAAAQPIVLTGTFEAGDLFRATYLANQPGPRLRLTVVGPERLELLFVDGWPGPARLQHTTATGELQTQEWPSIAPWADLVDTIEDELHLPTRPIEGSPTAIVAGDRPSRPAPAASWTDTIRALELDEAVHRSVHYRRAQTLDLQEASEEANFKGTMTLVGCSLMWLTLVLLFLSVWVPWLGWFIFPAIALFLGLQVLRWVVPPRPGQADRAEKEGEASERR